MPLRSRVALIGFTILSLVLFAKVHSLTGEASPVSDDQRQISFSSEQDSIWHIFQPESFGMFRPTKSLFF